MYDKLLNCINCHRNMVFFKPAKTWYCYGCDEIIVLWS